MNYIHLLAGYDSYKFSRTFKRYPNYIAYLDTDSIFTTPVSPEDLFDSEGRPIIIPRLYSQDLINNQFWFNLSENSGGLLNKTESFSCMTQFPAIFKISHIIELLEYLEVIHNKNLYDFLHEHEYRFGQYNVLCTYVWYFHRDEYNWHIQSSEKFNKIIHPGISPIAQIKAIYDNKEITKPVARVCDHLTYMKENIPLNIRFLMNYCQTCKELKICESHSLYNKLNRCKKYTFTKPYESLFSFEYFRSWLWDKRTKIAHTQHFYYIKKMLKKNFWTFNETILNMI